MNCGEDKLRVPWYRQGCLSWYVAMRTHTGLGMWGDIMLLGNLFGNSSGTFIGRFRPVRAKVTLHSSNGVEMPVHMGTRHTELPCYHPVSGSQSSSFLEDLRLNPAGNSHLALDTLFLALTVQLSVRIRDRSCQCLAEVEQKTIPF